MRPKEQSCAVCKHYRPPTELEHLPFHTTGYCTNRWRMTQKRDKAVHRESWCDQFEIRLGKKELDEVIDETNKEIAGVFKSSRDEDEKSPGVPTPVTKNDYQLLKYELEQQRDGLAQLRDNVRGQLVSAAENNQGGDMLEAKGMLRAFQQVIIGISQRISLLKAEIDAFVEKKPDA